MDPQEKKLYDALIIMHPFVGGSGDQARSSFHLYVFPIDAI